MRRGARVVSLIVRVRRKNEIKGSAPPTAACWHIAWRIVLFDGLAGRCRRLETAKWCESFLFECVSSTNRTFSHHGWARIRCLRALFLALCRSCRGMPSFRILGEPIPRIENVSDFQFDAGRDQLDLWLGVPEHGLGLVEGHFQPVAWFGCFSIHGSRRGGTSVFDIPNHFNNDYQS